MSENYTVPPIEGKINERYIRKLCSLLKGETSTLVYIEDEHTSSGEFVVTMSCADIGRIQECCKGVFVTHPEFNKAPYTKKLRLKCIVIQHERPKIHCISFKNTHNQCIFDTTDSRKTIATPSLVFFEMYDGYDLDYTLFEDDENPQFEDTVFITYEYIESVISDSLESLGFSSN